MHLFVYGSLRRQSAHRMARFLESDGRFVGAAKAPGRLYRLGRFPGMLQATGPDQWVAGDLFGLPQAEETLSELDRFEGLQFVRQEEKVILADGRSVQAWVYWYRGPVDEAQRIASGDYFT